MLLDDVERARRDLLSFGISDVVLDAARPVTPAGLRGAEEQIGREFPAALRQVFLNEAAGLRFQWETDQFGPDCKRGCAWLLSPRDVTEAYRSQLGVVQDALRGGLSAESEGYRALATDWPNWIPLFRFPSGDCFCLDVASGSVDPPLVFLEHDVMDVGPNLHGIRVATSFTDLVSRWGGVLFVDVYDWTRVVNQDGIDPQAGVFRPLAQVPRIQSIKRV